MDSRSLVFVLDRFAGANLDGVRRSQRPVGGPVVPVAAAAAAGGFAAGAAWMAWAVRGRSSTVFAPSIWHGPLQGREIALTFDDGPSESTPALIALLAKYGVRATFFVCGTHVRRLPEVLREVADAGHQIGNHTEHHAPLWLQGKAFLRREIGQAQEAIERVAGYPPVLFRAPYGVRWPGLGRVQLEHGLTGVMWTVIGRDWALDGRQTADRILRKVRPGAIVCLHDGRELRRNPDITSTLSAVREGVPRLLDAGWRFRDVREWIG